jgi:DNA-binding LacI/PurR family transcriptional regulator
MDTVVFDSEDGARKATEYLIQLGHRNMVFLGDITLPWYQRCYAGHAAAMRLHGLKVDHLEVGLEGSPFDYGARCVEQLLSRTHLPTAIVAGDDEIALGAMSELQRRGIEIPAGISVVGFDDISDVKYFRPLLTTVRVPKEEIGHALGEVLFRRLSKPDLKPVKKVLPTELILRESCATPRS